MEIISIIIDILILFVLVVGLNKFFPAYFDKKGSNLATKEDIGEITNEIEKVRKQYTLDIEILKAELARKSHVYNVQFEKEFDILYQLWNSLIGLRDIWNNMGSSILAGNEVHKDDKMIQAWRVGFRNSYIELRNLWEKNKPFFPEEVYHLLRKIMVDIGTEYNHIQSLELIMNDFIDKHDILIFNQQIDNVNKEIEDLCGLIRKRTIPE